MAKIEFNDFDEYLDKLQKLEKDDVVPIMKMSLYEGAGVVVDGIRSEIQSLNTSNHASQGPMDYEKKALEKGLVFQIWKVRAMISMSKLVLPDIQAIKRKSIQEVFQYH